MTQKVYEVTVLPMFDETLKIRVEAAGFKLEPDNTALFYRTDALPAKFSENIVAVFSPNWLSIILIETGEVQDEVQID